MHQRTGNFVNRAISANSYYRMHAFLGFLCGNFNGMSGIFCVHHFFGILRLIQLFIEQMEDLLFTLRTGFRIYNE